MDLIGNFVLLLFFCIKTDIQHFMLLCRVKVYLSDAGCHPREREEEEEFTVWRKDERWEDAKNATDFSMTH